MYTRGLEAPWSAEQAGSPGAPHRGNGTFILLANPPDPLSKFSPFYYNF
jgi:hypothetical protein